MTKAEFIEATKDYPDNAVIKIRDTEESNIQYTSWIMATLDDQEKDFIALW